MAYWIAPQNTAFIIVDVQNDFCPGGSLAVAGGDQIVSLISDLKRRFGLSILTQDWHPANHSSFVSNHQGKKLFDIIERDYGAQILWPVHCVQGTKGAEFRKDLSIQPNDLIIQKGTNPDLHSYSGFYEDDRKTRPVFANGKTLTETLREHGVKRLVIAGLAYDFCVGWNALDAVRDGFEAIVLKDATRSITLPPEAKGGLNSEQAMTKQLEEADVRIINSNKLKYI